MELINNLQHEPQQYQHSYFRSTIILLLVLVMVRAEVNAGRSGLRAHKRHLRAKCPITGAKAETRLSGQVRAHHKDPGAPLRSHLTVLMGEADHPLGIWAEGSAPWWDAGRIKAVTQRVGRGKPLMPLFLSGPLERV